MTQLSNKRSTVREPRTADSAWANVQVRIYEGRNLFKTSRVMTRRAATYYIEQRIVKWNAKDGHKFRTYRLVRLGR